MKNSKKKNLRKKYLRGLKKEDFLQEWPKKLLEGFVKEFLRKFQKNTQKIFWSYCTTKFNNCGSSERKVSGKHKNNLLDK